MEGLPLGRYSSEVTIRLIVGDLELDVAQIARKTLVLREPHELPPATEGRLIIKVDEREESRHVVLHEGTTHNSTRVNFT